MSALDSVVMCDGDHVTRALWPGTPEPCPTITLLYPAYNKNLGQLHCKGDQKSMFVHSSNAFKRP